MNAFINTQGILTAFGFMSENNADTLIEVANDFNLQSGAWQYAAGEWIEYSPTATPASTAATALINGISITSTSTPAINGIYPLDSATQFEINSVMLFIQTTGDFPGGMSSYPWFDAVGIPHTFPSTAVFKEWATAIANYVAALKLYAAGTPGAMLPTASVTIS